MLSVKSSRLKGIDNLLLLGENSAWIINWFYDGGRKASLSMDPLAAREMSDNIAINDQLESEVAISTRRRKRVGPFS